MTNRDNRLLDAETTRAILDAFRDVYRELGFGHREKIYSLAMERARRSRPPSSARVLGDGVLPGDPLARESIDMVIDDKVVVENKSAVRLRPADHDQLLGYLTSTYLEVGLLLHFGPTAEFYRKVYENRFKAHVRKYGAPQL